MISLESVDGPTEEVVPEPEVVPEVVPEVAEPDVAPDVIAPGLVNDIEEVPVPKRRGRPPKAKTEAPKAAPKAAAKAAPKTAPKTAAKAAPKAAPKRAKTRAPSVSSDESSDDVALSRDDMDTLLMQYLLDRKTNQRDQRRAMWSQMAGLV